MALQSVNATENKGFALEEYVKFSSKDVNVKKNRKLYDAMKNKFYILWKIIQIFKNTQKLEISHFGQWERCRG